MAVRKYNPKKIVGFFAGSVAGREFMVAFSGFMDGSFVQAQYDENRVTKHTGGHGDTTFVLNPSKGAQLSVTFVQGAEANDALSLLVPDADRNYLPIGVVSIADLNGRSVFLSDEACIANMPGLVFGQNVEGRQWTFECGKAQIHVGGSAEVA